MYWKDASLEYTICYCKDVTKRRIIEAINEGARSIEDIMESTGACTGSECEKKNPHGRSCRKDISEMLDFFVPFAESIGTRTKRRRTIS